MKMKMKRIVSNDKCFEVLSPDPRGLIAMNMV